jgi:hypothetical protein
VMIYFLAIAASRFSGSIPAGGSAIKIRAVDH